MKISEFSTERAMDVLCELIEPVSDILADEDLMTELKSAVDLSNTHTQAEQLVIVGQKMTKIAPIVFKKRRNDVCKILALLNETDVEAVAKQNILKTMSQIRDIAKDKELLDFFKSCTSSEGSE